MGANPARLAVGLAEEWRPRLEERRYRKLLATLEGPWLPITADAGKRSLAFPTLSRRRSRHLHVRVL